MSFSHKQGDSPVLKTITSHLGPPSPSTSATLVRLSPWDMALPSLCTTIHTGCLDVSDYLGM